MYERVHQSCHVTVLFQAVPSNAAKLPNLSEAEKAKNRYRNVLPSK